MVETASISPKTEKCEKDRSKLYKRRNESPTFRDVLRERCHSRIKASRRALLDEFRQRADPGEVRDVLFNLLHDEMRLLKKGAPDVWEGAVEDEQAEDGEEQWLIREYEKILEEEELAFLEMWENEMICPVCERSALTETIDESISCPKCNQRYPNGTTLHDLRRIVDRSVADHNVSCQEKMNFALIDENESTGFYVLCESCGLFANLS